MPCTSANLFGADNGLFPCIAWGYSHPLLALIALVLGSAFCKGFTFIPRTDFSCPNILYIPFGTIQSLLFLLQSATAMYAHTFENHTSLQTLGLLATQSIFLTGHCTYLCTAVLQMCLDAPGNLWALLRN